MSHIGLSCNLRSMCPHWPHFLGLSGLNLDREDGVLGWDQDALTQTHCFGLLFPQETPEPSIFAQRTLLWGDPVNLPALPCSFSKVTTNISSHLSCIYYSYKNNSVHFPPFKPHTPPTTKARSTKIMTLISLFASIALHFWSRHSPGPIKKEKKETGLALMKQGHHRNRFSAVALQESAAESLLSFCTASTWGRQGGRGEARERDLKTNLCNGLFISVWHPCHQIQSHL